MNDSDNKIARPVLCLSEEGDEETWLVGNHAGLVVLREAIDNALASGEAPFTAEGIEIGGISCRETPLTSTPETIGSKLAGWGCIVVMVICLAIFIFGIVQLVGKLL
jgi:hypothetical protein